MPDQYSDNDLLHRYLRGDIDGRQEAELERRAASDPALLEAMEGVQALPEHDHAASVSAMLARAEATIEKPAEAKVRRLPRYWWAAAAGLLLLLTTVFLFPGPFGGRDEGVAMSAPKEETAAEPARSELSATFDDGLEEEPGPEVEMEPSPSVPPAPAPAAAPRPERAKIAQQEAPAAQETVEDLNDEAEENEVISIAEEVEILAETAPLPIPAASTEALAAPQISLNERTAGAAAGGEGRDVERVGSSAQKKTARAQKPVSAQYLTGRITDENGNPIANATVFLPGLPLGETTDSLGAFQINFDATTTLLRIEAEGFATETIEVNGRPESLQVTLDAVRKYDDTAFPTGSVVSIDLANVTGGRLRAREPGYAKPAKGYRTLRNLIEAGRPAVVPDGKVKFSFVVNPDGTITDYQFRKKTGEPTREYLRDAVKEQTEWEVKLSEKPVRVHLKVVFR